MSQNQRNTSLIDKENARSYIQFLKDARIPFTLTCSNYTTKISCEIFDKDKKFVHAMQSNRCFAAFSKVKSDIKEQPVPLVNRNQMVYFVHDFNRSMKLSQIMNIDLKSAYATILKMDGIITDKTYSYLQTISKQDRLAAIGMLASKKKVFKFDSTGRIYDYEEKRSNKEGFFFYAVKRTYEIMSALKAIIGEGYLFTWVDGIYFKPDFSKLDECEKYLESIGFRYTIDVLSKFNLVYDQSGIRLSFQKNGKVKRFNLPPRTSEFNSIMVDAIMQYNHDKPKTDEKASKIKNAP